MSDVVAFHKPKGCIVTHRDERGRRTVFDLLPGRPKLRSWPGTGRLRLHTQAIMQFKQRVVPMEEVAAPTWRGGRRRAFLRNAQLRNLGWARRDGWTPAGRLDADSRGLLLMRRRALVAVLTRPGACDKTYEVWVRGRVADAHLDAMRRGVASPVGPLRVKAVERLGGAGPRSRLSVTLDEGRNRHLRRLFGALRDPKVGTAIGPLPLDVPSGRCRFLTDAEIDRLRARP